MSRGQVVVEGTPNELKPSLEGDSVTVELADGNTPEARAHHRGVWPACARCAPRDGSCAAASTAARAPSRRSSPRSTASGIAVEAVDSHRPSLDDVYLHYTGRDFRVEDEEVAE